MPHLKSAKKRLKQNIKRRALNRATIKDLRTQMKKVLKAADSGDAQSANTELRTAAKKLDKCAERGYIHKNAAARHKARLSHRVNAIGAAASKE